MNGSDVLTNEYLTELSSDTFVVVDKDKLDNVEYYKSMNHSKQNIKYFMLAALFSYFTLHIESYFWSVHS